ncbi:winged helix-turn-helix transcriptional regulator [Nonomuraea cypriaca]|uniref:winged helix-turn-helix transcriptional regulator n=1 Tax=Nonomuraea cypriaca TaxID=1187855 RepID=UPI0038B2974A
MPACSIAAVSLAGRPGVHYTLTPHGRRLGPVLQALWDWGAQPLVDSAGCTSRFQ